MMRLRLVVILVLGCMSIMVWGSSSLVELLPASGELPGWKPGGNPQQYQGEDLYLLINGGAEIYQEYGFKQVIAESYKSENSKTINLEIYEMNDGPAAFGIYTFKISGEGRSLNIGQGSRMEDYYLNFWKGSYLVTLIGFDTEQETMQGIGSMAALIDKKIKAKGKFPSLLERLPRENLQAGFPKYFKGNLALFNHCDFVPPDLLDVKEGILGNYNSYRVLILNRENQDRNLADYKRALTWIKEKQPQKLYLDHAGSFLVFIQGETPDRAGALFKRITASWDSN